MTSLNHGQSAQDAAQSRKAYSTPRLFVHGNIEELTGGGLVGVQDGDNTGTQTN